jgi:hypothetical protein
MKQSLQSAIQRSCSCIARNRQALSFQIRLQQDPWLPRRFSFSGVLYVGVRQHVPEFFRLRRLCRYPGATCELCISEIKRLKTHTCRITRDIDYRVTRFGDHPLSILARVFHAHGFIGSEQGARYFVRSLLQATGKPSNICIFRWPCSEPLRTGSQWCGLPNPDFLEP